MTKVNKEMIENIKNYSSELKTLKSFVEAVRQMPGMYIGYTGNRGFINMIREIFQNSVDEMMKASSPCDRIFVTYDENTNETIIEDNGRGIPFNDIIRVYTSEHTSSNYEKKLGEYSSGTHGVGGKVTNALSSKFKVESYILGEARRMEFKEGFPVYENPKKISNKNNKQGTIVSFIPCKAIMGEITTSADDVLELLNCILPLVTIGGRIEFIGIKRDGTINKTVLINTDGIMGRLRQIATNPLTTPIEIHADTGTMKADIGFTYDSNNLDTERIISYSNFCPMMGGTHEDGFKLGITNFFRKYMNNIYLANTKNKKLSIVNNDILTGLSAVISVSHLHPMFTGQAKDMLANEDMKPFIKDLVIKALEDWTKSNPQDLQKVCKYIKEVAEIRLKSEEGKVKLTSRYEASSISGMPKKYTKPVIMKDPELFIVEGDSANGSAKNIRAKNQALYPIRGKLPNAFTTPRAKFLSNAEVSGIITITGGGYGKNFNLKKVPWKYVIFMCDADIDAAQIKALLLKLYLLYMPQMIEDGRVYAAVPPLYGIERKSGTTYLTDKMDYTIHIQKEFSRTHTVSSMRGKVLTQKQLTKVLYDNSEYLYDIKTISERYKVDPKLLEFVVINKDLPYTKFKKLVESNYQFIKVNKKNGIIVVEGLHNKLIQTIVFSTQFLNDIKVIEKYIKNNESMYYKLNGVPCSLYDLLDEFEKSSPSNIARYKGKLIAQVLVG